MLLRCSILSKSGLYTNMQVLKDNVFNRVILTAINYHTTIDSTLQFYTGVHININLNNACGITLTTKQHICNCVELQASCYIHCCYALMLLLFFTKIMSTTKREAPMAYLPIRYLYYKMPDENGLQSLKLYHVFYTVKLLFSLQIYCYIRLAQTP